MTYDARGRAARAVLLLGLASAGARASGQTSAPSPSTMTPQVRILAPSEDTVVVGPTRLRAEVKPPNLVSSVDFSVDGRAACTAMAPTFECEWDAGSTIAPRQVRLAANLVAGGRVVRTTRTKGMEFAETVDVDVVQVTVTVPDGHGHYVRGLSRSAFHVSEDGRP